MRVTVEPYNPEWASQFKTISKDIQRILNAAEVHYKSIEHVGSTPIPGCAAKPHVDLDIVVSEEQAQPAIGALVQTGLYKYLGEYGIPQRHAMLLLIPDESLPFPRWNTYVCVEGSQGLRNHLAVRDTCRTNSKLRDQYSNLKLELAQREWGDIMEYCVAKNEVLGRILTEAGMGSEVEAIRVLNVDAGNNKNNTPGSVNSEISNT